MRKKGRVDLGHAACDVFEIVLLVRFESGSPTIFQGKRDGVGQFLSSGALVKHATLSFELVNVILRWLFPHSPTRKVPIRHILLQRGFWGIVSR